MKHASEAPRRVLENASRAARNCPRLFCTRLQPFCSATHDTWDSHVLWWTAGQDFNGDDVSENGDLQGRGGSARQQGGVAGAS